MRAWQYGRVVLFAESHLRVLLERALLVIIL